LAQATTQEKISGAKKAAIVLLTLGKEAAAKIMKGLKESDIEKIAVEMANLGPVPKELQERVLAEFTGAMASGGQAIGGGEAKVAEILEAAIGKAKASEIVARIRRQKATGAISKLEQMSPETVAEFLKNEHPQTIALIVAQFEADFAARVLAALPGGLRGEVALRIATMDAISADATEEINRILATQLEGIGGGQKTSAGGVKALADILNQGERTLEEEVLSAIEEKDNEVAGQVRKLMFVFDDILLLDDRSMQRVLREVDSKDLAVALKGADEKIKEKIFKNISERAAAMIQEEIDYMGPKRVSEVEAAQQAITEDIRKLEESGEIMIPGRGGASDDLII